MRIDIDVHELPRRFDEALKAMANGDEIYLIADGRACAKLAPLLPRTLDLHPGAFQMAPDFDDPLPDEFWINEDNPLMKTHGLPPHDSPDQKRLDCK
ncbi:type II toxin-antitoxin system Phd/YefM family antitoxin [Anatilimnocola sp. NA78]|uniref:type II toxin-antitoxin system Phd/YefM family antitoxin n=1 Tax=Anatilimnocola sp. NA78 TaxID=3415683 RepID=UPI003CE53823